MAERKRRLDVGSSRATKKKRESKWDTKPSASAAATAGVAGGPGQALNVSGSVNPLNGRQFSANYYEILKVRQSLPVYQFIDELHKNVLENQVIVVEGETGSGKTTQIPSALLYKGFNNTPEGRKLICCTQPRRVAATSVAKRVAEELDVSLGQQVGYTIRFDDCTNQGTMLKYMTDGMLLREAMSDPLLSRYAVVILDEVRLRSAPGRLGG